jgi:hypothetical protein
MYMKTLGTEKSVFKVNKENVRRCKKVKVMMK